MNHHSKRKKAKQTGNHELPMRLNKFIAHCGVTSRRKAANLVKNGSITINGSVEHNPSYFVEHGDTVTYDGEVLELEEEKVYILLNKPKNTITTVDDPRGRKSVLDLVGHKTDVRIFPVGRLDRNSVGLLLLTNDGELAQKLSHPSYEFEKVYEVVLDRALSKEDLNELRSGIDLEDGPIKPDAVNYVHEKTKRDVSIELHSGRNRIVRRIFEHMEYEVKKLDRVYYAGLTKKGLSRGKSRFLTEEEIRRLKHFT